MSAGLDNGLNFMVDHAFQRPMLIFNKLPFDPLKNPEHMKELMKNNDKIEFSRSIEKQIGGQLKAGFILTDIYEDFNNDAESMSDGISPFWTIRAVKKSDKSSNAK